jgi:hypothetical protein
MRCGSALSICHHRCLFHHHRFIALAVRRNLKLEDMRDLTPWIPLGFFVFYGFGVFWLVLTAHQGAMLAHELLPGAAR